MPVLKVKKNGIWEPVSGGGVTSWNDLEDKPFYIKDEGWEITYDPETFTGDTYIDLGNGTRMVLVSDMTPSNEELKNCEGTMVSSDGVETAPMSSMWDYFEQQGMITDAYAYFQFGMVVRDTSVTTPVGTAPKTGSYFMDAGTEYVSALGEADEIKTLDRMFLPSDGFVGKNGTAEGSEIFNNYERNKASGGYSHAEGYNTRAEGFAAHAEGNWCVAEGDYSHAEGDSYASGKYSHAEGWMAGTKGECAHGEGYGTNSHGYASHAEGRMTGSFGTGSHSEGSSTAAFYGAAHAEGESTVALHGHAEGFGSVKDIRLVGDAGVVTYVVSQGFDSITDNDIGEFAYVPDIVNNGVDIDYGDYVARLVSIDRNSSTITFDKTLSKDEALDGSEVINWSNNVAYAYGSHTEGSSTIAMGEDQHVQGRFNIIDEDGKYAHIVGNGNYNFGDSFRSNAHTLDWDGNAWFAGDVYVGSTSGTNQDDGSKKLVAAPTTAQVGQVIAVKSVDANGRPTEWEAVDMGIANMSLDEIVQAVIAALPNAEGASF